MPRHGSKKDSGSHQKDSGSHQTEDSRRVPVSRFSVSTDGGSSGQGTSEQSSQIRDDERAAALARLQGEPVSRFSVSTEGGSFGQGTSEQSSQIRDDERAAALARLQGEPVSRFSVSTEGGSSTGPGPSDSRNPRRDAWYDGPPKDAGSAQDETEKQRADALARLQGKPEGTRPTHSDSKGEPTSWFTDSTSTEGGSSTGPTHSDSRGEPTSRFSD